MIVDIFDTHFIIDAICGFSVAISLLDSLYPKLLAYFRDKLKANLLTFIYVIWSLLIIALINYTTNTSSALTFLIANFILQRFWTFSLYNIAFAYYLMQLLKKDDEEISQLINTRQRNLIERDVLLFYRNLQSSANE